MTMIVTDETALDESLLGEVPDCEVRDDEAEGVCGKPAAALMLCEVRHMPACEAGSPGQYELWACGPHLEDAKAGRLACCGCRERVTLIRYL